MTIHWGLQKPFLGSQINLAHPLAQRLVALYLMNEASGNTIINLVDGSIGTLTGMAFPPTATSGWNPGENGPALAFDGDNDYVDLGSSSRSMLVDTSKFSVSLWLKTLSTERDIVIGSYDGTADAGWTIDINRGASIPDAGKIFIFTRTQGGGSDLSGYTTSDTTINNGELHHLIVVWDLLADTFFVYLDGISHAVTFTNTDSGDTIDSLDRNVFIGALNNEGFPGIYSTGLIDDVRIYNRALTASEIMELYLAPYSMFDIEWWPWLSAAVAAGLSIPVAIHHYRQQRIA